MTLDPTPNSEAIQKAIDGVGPLYHRVYAIEIPVPFKAALASMERLQADTNEFTPKYMARFEKTQGAEESLKKGDCFQIHITGPWNGPVTACEVNPEHFVFRTLEGHLEAGEIHFRIREISADLTRFEIESVARSRDKVVDFVYDKIPILKLAQTNMWEAVCKNFAFHALRLQYPGNHELQVESEVTVLTERKNEETGQWEAL